MRIEDLKYTTPKSIQLNILKQLYKDSIEYKKNRHIKVFAYSHLKDANNIKKIINRKPELTDKVLKGYSKYKNTDNELVIKKDKQDSNVKGKVFTVNEKEYKKIVDKMKPYKSKMADKKEDLVSFYKKGSKLNKLGVSNSLWNNIRESKGSGNKPTKEMLKQERKIKLKKYEVGGKLNQGNKPMEFVLSKTDTIRDHTLDGYELKNNQLVQNKTKSIKGYLKPVKPDNTFTQIGDNLYTKIKTETNDKAMVNGVADIVSKVKDSSNRKEIGKAMLTKFKNENVKFDKSEFLNRSKIK